jgi:outer membrane receptor protein involved in Fe transport
LSSGLDIPAGNARTWLIPDMDAAVGVLDLNNSTLYPMGIQPSLGNNNEIEEDDLGAYIQGDFKFDLGGRTLRGNVGVRYVQTDLTSEGYTFTSGVPLLQTVTHEYSDTLPSLNLVYDFTDEFLVRFAASKVITRPNLGNLNPGAR